MPGINRNTSCLVFVGGSQVDNVISASVSLGYDMHFGNAKVVVAGPNPGGTYFDDLSIVVSDGSQTHTWFSGLLLAVDFDLYPQTVTLNARGRLWQAAQFKLTGDLFGVAQLKDGLFLDDLIGAPSGTDQDIVQAALAMASLGGSIGGNSRVYGTIAPGEFAWKENESALSYIQRLDAISGGFRTFETTGGAIFRSQVSSVPGGGINNTFEEGVDIASGSANKTVLESFNAVRVSGYDVGDFLEPRIFYVSGSGVIDGTNTFTFDSKMIERRAESSEGEGMSCEFLANFWLGQLNREIIKLTLVTPRNDDIGPGQVHQINGANRLGTSDQLWVQRVDKNYSSSGVISQSITYVGGGA